jgi:hypothetical protein
MKILNRFLLLSSIVILNSCGTKAIPNNAVYLQENQLNLINGYYELISYESFYSQDYKDLSETFHFPVPRLVTYIELEFISKKELKISYEIDGISEQKIVKGKHKHGGFYLEKNWGALGIPPFIWLQWNRGKRIFMGNDDNLILDEFDDSSALLFGFQSRTNKRQTYLYDRLYSQIYTGQTQQM